MPPEGTGPPSEQLSCVQDRVQNDSVAPEEWLAGAGHIGQQWLAAAECFSIPMEHSRAGGRKGLPPQ